MNGNIIPELTLTARDERLQEIMGYRQYCQEIETLFIVLRRCTGKKTLVKEANSPRNQI